MEKSAKRFRKIACGLLIFIFNPLVFSQEMISEKNSYFCEESVEFAGIIDSAAPSEISFFLQELPDGATHIASKKSALFKNEKLSTKIEIILIFSRAGKFTLPPLRVTATGKEDFFLPFNSIEIRENIGSFVASAYWKLDEEQFSGEKFSVSLVAKNVQKILTAKFDSPENSLFEKHGKMYSTFEFDKENPIATENVVQKFDWTVFNENAVLPPAYLSVVDFSGNKINIAAESVVLENLQKAQKVSVVDAKKYFFSEIPEISEESFDFAEKMQKINEIKLKNLILLCIFSTFFAIFLILFFVFLLKKSKLAFIFFILMLAAAGFSCFQFFKRQTKIAIVENDEIYTLPDFSASKLRDVKTGDLIFVKKKVDEWYFFESNGISGWASQSAISFPE